MLYKPTFVKRVHCLPDNNYQKWFGKLKLRLQKSQIKAAVKVNTALLEFYCSLSRDIVILKAEQTCGSGMIKQLSLDFKDAFPG